MGSSQHFSPTQTQTLYRTSNPGERYGHPFANFKTPSPCYGRSVCARPAPRHLPNPRYSRRPSPAGGTRSARRLQARTTSRSTRTYYRSRKRASGNAGSMLSPHFPRLILIRSRITITSSTRGAFTMFLRLARSPRIGMMQWGWCLLRIILIMRMMRYVFALGFFIYFSRGQADDRRSPAMFVSMGRSIHSRRRSSMV